MGRRRLLVLVNFRASRAATLLGDAVARLASLGFDIDLRQSADRADLCRIVQSGADGADAVVVAGGDGTVNGALSALMAAERPVGILPLGTANDLALTLGISADPIAAADVIAAGAIRRIDVGRVNDSYFLNVASIGLSTKIAEKQDQQLKQEWGIFSYVVAAVGTLTDAERFEAVITCDGRAETVRAYQIAVGNGIHYGGGLTVSPEAAIDDGLLDIYAIETASVAELIALAPRLRDGTLVERDDVAFYRCREARVETPTPTPVNTDGEVMTETPAAFSVLPKALAIFAPADTTQD